MSEKFSFQSMKNSSHKLETFKTQIAVLPVILVSKFYTQITSVIAILPSLFSLIIQCVLAG
jgi:hypothetical protein